MIVDNLIIFYYNSLLYFYDLNTKKIDNINFFSKKEIKVVNLFKINKRKILLSTNNKGLIIDIKTKQVETYINNFRNIFCMEKIGKFMLVGTQSKICQINIKKGEIYNEYIDNYYFNKNVGFISSIVDIGNNQFCLLYHNDFIYLFNYN